MDSLPEQHIDSLPRKNRAEAYQQVGVVCICRRDGYSEDEVARKAGFSSVEDMYLRLERWGLSGLLPLKKKSEEASQVVRKRKARQAKGEPEVLPPPTNASPLFTEALHLLGSELKTLPSLKETWQGGRFMGEAVGGAEKGTVGRGAFGGRWFPNLELTRLIAACIVADGSWSNVERLLRALHPHPTEANRRQLGQFIYGRDGFVLRVLQIAALVRGAPEIGRGVKADPISAAEQYIAWEIREQLDEGLSEEETAQKTRAEWGIDQDEYARLRNLAKDF